MKKWSSTLTVPTLLILIIFVLNFLWFNPFDFHVFIGDDLNAWNYFNITKDNPIHYIFQTTLANKYRPVFNTIQYILFFLFGDSYKNYFYFSIVLNFINLIVFFKIIVRITSNYLISFCFVMILLVNRFSYYNVLQLFGVMEAVALLLFLILIYSVIELLNKPTGRKYLCVIILELLLIFTHERYLVVFPALMLTFYLSIPGSFRKKISFSLFPLIPVLLNIFIKKFLLKIVILEGTAGTHISVDFFSILKFVLYGLSNMFGINMGEAYLNGISINHASSTTLALTILLVIIYMGILLNYIFKFKVRNDSLNLRFFFVVSLLMMGTILSASVTIRQEYRWLYSPYCAFLIIAALFITKLKSKRVVLPIVLMALVFINVKNDYYYKNFLSNVYFIDAQNIGESAKKAIIDAHRTEIINKKIYIQKNTALDWTFLDSEFFKVYTGNPDLKVVYFDDYSQIDFKNSLVFKLNGRRRIEQLQFNASIEKSEEILASRWSIPDDPYPKITIHGEKLYYTTFATTNINPLFKLVRNDDLKVFPLSAVANSDSTVQNLEPGKIAIYSIDASNAFLWISTPNDNIIDNVKLLKYE